MTCRVSDGGLDQCCMNTAADGTVRGSGVACGKLYLRNRARNSLSRPNTFTLMQTPPRLHSPAITIIIGTVEAFVRAELAALLVVWVSPSKKVAEL
jgi:hypothetical protein